MSDHLLDPVKSLVLLFWPTPNCVGQKCDHTSVIAGFRPAQTNCTKGGNKPEFNSTSPNKAGVQKKKNTFKNMNVNDPQNKQKNLK